jgi:hypothetical protein
MEKSQKMYTCTYLKGSETLTMKGRLAKCKKPFIASARLLELDTLG